MRLARASWLLSVSLGLCTGTASAVTVTTVFPEGGLESGSTTVAIIGTGFQPGATAYFSGTAAIATTYVNSTQLNATTPPGTGTVDVTVTNPDLSSGTLVGGFTYLPPLSVTGVSPANGPETGGTGVTITGTGFITGAFVVFGMEPADNVVVVSSTEITCVTPPGAATVSVWVGNPDSQLDELPGAFTYDVVPPPTVTGVGPGNGPETGGTSVTITGTGFMPGAWVYFGMNAASGVSVVGPTQITCSSPPGFGTVDVVVMNADGDSGVLSAAFAYDVVPPPTVSDVNPGSGLEAGGTSVTVTGTGFVDGAAVFFGVTVATDISVVSGTEITCKTPPGTGTVDILVMNTDGDSGILSAAFTYRPPPTVTAVDPDSGPESGFTVVTITGTGFEVGAMAYFGGFPAISTTYVDSATVTALTLSGTGTVDVTVTNPDAQSGTLPGSFTYVPPPNISAVNPGNGPETGSTSVTITGSGFQAGALVAFGISGEPATNVVVVSATEITCETPPHPAGAVPVWVDNPDGQSDALADAYTYDVVPPPTVVDVDPGIGPEPGGRSVTITGTGFVDGAAVFFGAAAATDVSVVSGTEITCTTPAGTGTVDVLVMNTDGDSGILSAAYTYRPPPAVTAVDPSIGLESGNSSVTITGTGFWGGGPVRFGGTLAAVTFANPTFITCLTPAGSGTVDVTVTNADTQSDTLVGGFTYIGVPTVSGVAPSSGPETGGTSVTITGTKFAAGAAVDFGGTPATNVSVVSATEITCDAPPGAGTVGITVTNPLLLSGTLPACFTYDAPPADDKGCAPGPAGVPAGTLLLVLSLVCLTRRGRWQGAHPG